MNKLLVELTPLEEEALIELFERLGINSRKVCILVDLIKRVISND